LYLYKVTQVTEIVTHPVFKILYLRHLLSEHSLSKTNLRALTL